MAKALQQTNSGTRKISRKELLLALLKNGILDQKSGALDKAIQRFSKALSIAPQHPAGYMFRASAWTQKGELQRAIADYNAAIRLDLSCAEGYYRRAMVWQQLGMSSRSEMDFKKAADLDPNYELRENSDAAGSAYTH